ncbi:VIP36-like protein isoform X2 [Heptranchias perlo]|uniref:VIP36-like protein isoform X2 n=1 Tax=Heptranchias perlo TaxID=212740 RepID=UPI003559F48C
MALGAALSPPALSPAPAPARALSLTLLLAALILQAPRTRGQSESGTEEYLKREHSLTKPYQGLGASGFGTHWDLSGNTMVTTHFVRLTPDLQSKQGAIWNRVACYLRDWEVQVHFKIHGQGKKNLNGDGFAIWYTKDRMQPGAVFGSKDLFSGLGIFMDTYPNEEKQHERIFPYVSAMVNNGSLSYDHSRDGRPTAIGGCTALVRNLNHDTFIVIRYLKRRLTVMIDIDGKNEWKDCIDIPGVKLPLGYYFGASSATGDLTDNHDIISLKIYQLTVERKPEEEEEFEEVLIPSVDNFRLQGDDLDDEPMSGLTLFFISFFSLVGLVVIAVIGIIVFQKWQEQNRKRFY